ncbi:polyglutamine-binding protein 1-like isoform X2 [Pomacea canaliculata]|uniref:polyglutamine-binding protein 1-like isoform X2 n=1 Tax=Pomacea canaliculata TaxID=400727 RepID=UPI000D72B5C6|nr:polyglutamine-binding protein 1-like isoform X2 [Pomacea canaliculata]
MPLPPALLARLAKRGIVAEQHQTATPRPEEIEEVFAEDYDDPTKLDGAEPSPAIKRPVGGTDNVAIAQTEDDTAYVHEATACPNKGNPYHVCVKYCKNRWGMKKFLPEVDMTRRRDRMLTKYPLPEGWREVADPDSNRYYYWNIQTDQVCWLSPGHPKAVITMSADKLNAATGRTRLSSLEDEFDDDDETENMDEKMDAESDTSDSMSDLDSEDDIQAPRRDRGAGRSRPGRGKGLHPNADRRGRKRKDDLDPMDPAAYSDIPRGSWTDGLDMRGSAKTGVDVTASGPLFQQRPYPSPGDILRANQQLKKKAA